MRFLLRGLTGLFLMSVTLGLLVFGAGLLRSDEAEEPSQRFGRPGGERSFSVPVETVALTEATPVITTFGTVDSARILELRAPQGGPVTELSAAFRDGGEVAQGEVLLRIDPAEAQAARDRAAAERQDAAATLTERRAGLVLAGDELTAAIAQRDLRARALARQQDLRARGVGTDATVEAAELALSQADQTVLTRRQALLSAEAAVPRAQIALDRADIALREADRALQETEITAPFAGVLTETSAALGRRVSANERLGLLIDRNALDVAFRVTNAEFARLVARDGTMRSDRATVTLDLDAVPFSAPATIERTGVATGEGETGRQLFARLGSSAANVMRPGDFVTVTVAEPALGGVAVLPATALTADGRVLIVTADNRLEEVQTEMLRRQGDDVILRGLAEGLRFVVERQPQLGPGILVTPLVTEETAATTPEPATIRLDDTRRAALRAFVEGNNRMPAQAKQRLLAALEQPDVPVEMVNRLEQRMGG
ncbi:multidrug efflux pump subunit AcrA (membrane-fusion protein) [Rubricella aquisinus]|uniref:Multidrug efflux pump subunit AcrA (Membrane-fusion protein) n=1 Tax=Rubricella aquisinus TaxID=2028108 RepID=A0A840X196_9RHOB|nr:HlyD family efflux transporter periplasmic adaptor subunit [Rubricella aquisinus]MBB5514427.1 multidrug efflux pump subunit AcrA (membrane-fusion protein) [Rubricella aquisinus]